MNVYELMDKIDKDREKAKRTLDELVKRRKELENMESLANVFLQANESMYTLSKELFDYVCLYDIKSKVATDYQKAGGIVEIEQLFFNSKVLFLFSYKVLEIVQHDLEIKELK